MRKAGLLWTVLLGANAALAQSQDALNAGALAQPSINVRTFTDEDQAGRIVGQAHPARGERSGEDCPTGYLYGQVYGEDTNPNCNAAYYSDLNFCSGGCQRVRYENFPPPNATITGAAIGIVTWRGVFLDAGTSGCDKPGAEFRIRFYPLDPNGGPDPNTPYPFEFHVPILKTDTGERLNFGGTVPAILWQFTVVLDTPVTLDAGWMGLTCVTDLGSCSFLWDSSAEGDNVLYEDWESDGWDPVIRTGTCEGVNYCFGEKQLGACCDDCSQTCTDNVTLFECEGLGGRFVQNTLCSNISPPCGAELGACCHDDGSCDPQVTCADCQGGTPPPCIGDLNCDGFIDFGDINPFVQYMSNYPAWVAAYPTCNPLNGDINCDGAYGQSAFGDINPFVSLMTQCGSGCTCPGPGCRGAPRAQGPSWRGWNSVCDPNDPADPFDPNYPLTQCCTIVPGGNQENEPDNCAAPDTFNGGCDWPGDHFTTLTCGATVYGQSGTQAGYADRDWYQVTTTSAQSFTATVQAEFDVRLEAYRAGPATPCDGFHEIASAVAPALVFGAPGHNACTPVVLATRCLPAGTYFFVVSPAYSSGVLCGSDYKLTVSCVACTPTPPPACPPTGAHSLQETDPNTGQPLYCYDDPATPDPNGGCNIGPDPANFEALPQTPSDPNDSFTFCGKLAATGGYRDTDWYSLDIPLLARVNWTVETQLPVRATLLFFDSADPTVYGPPPADCSPAYYWTETLFSPGPPGTWDATVNYGAGHYFFLVAPEDASGPLFYGYPCPMDGADLGNEYQVTMSVTSIWCDSQILAKPHCCTEAEPINCDNPVGYVDNYNNGCDPGDPNQPMLPITFDAANGWVSESGTWLTDPNDPNTLVKDYDWYKLTLTGNRRFKVYLYSNFPATWEIVDPQDPNAPGVGCDKGPTEGLEVDACFDQGVYTRRCYTGSTSSPSDYYLRVFPTGRANCGLHYWLALTEALSCNLCAYSCSGQDLDDPCDDVNDYDTNAGCDDPNAPPPHFMTFNCGGTYCGRSYAGQAYTGLEYYDPDWFQLTQTNSNPRRLRLTVTAEFLAHVEVYLSCDDYAGGGPLAGLDAVTPLTGSTACPTMIMTGTTSLPQGTTVYGRITMVDQFGNLLTKYYPCVKGYNKWKVVTACLV
jgi:hypothetical protein